MTVGVRAHVIASALSTPDPAGTHDCAAAAVVFQQLLPASHSQSRTVSEDFDEPHADTTTKTITELRISQIVADAQGELQLAHARCIHARACSTSPQAPSGPTT